MSFKLIYPVSLVALVLCLLLPLVSLGPIGGSSEAREAHIAQIIADTGDWVLPLRNGILPSKPPLYHWLVAGAAKLTGWAVTPGMARLPSALAAAIVLGLVCALAIFVGRHAPQHLRSQSFRLCLISSAVLFGSYGFAQLALDCRVDMTYALFVNAAVASVLFGLLSARGLNSWHWLFFFISAALAVLAKGPLGFVLPAVLVFCLCAVMLGTRKALLECFRPRWSWLACLLIAFPWYLLAWQRGSSAFLSRQLIFENILRLVGGEDVNSEPWWFYFPSILRTAFPWSLIFFVCSFERLRSWKNRRLLAETFGDYGRIKDALCLAVWVGLIVFSSASGKRHAYLAPLFPLMSLVVSLWILETWQFLSDSARLRMMRSIEFLLWTGLLLAVLLGVLPEILGLLDPLRGSAEFVRGWLMGESARLQLYAFIVSASFVGALRARGLVRLGLGCFAASGLMACLTGVGIGAKNMLKGFDRAGLVVMNRVPTSAKLTFIRQPRDEYFDPLMYYVRRPASTAELQKLVPVQGEYLVVQSQDLNELQARITANSLNLEKIADLNLLDDIGRGRTDRGYYLVILNQLTTTSPLNSNRDGSSELPDARILGRM
ncbi:MAG: hypothetical protein K1X79_11830 [Oligoflexia bacterium]|nr:hypothetical protein [Oligoflexia bacterium]